MYRTRLPSRQDLVDILSGIQANKLARWRNKTGIANHMLQLPGLVINNHNS